MVHLRSLFIGLMVCLCRLTASGELLQDYARNHPMKLFVATRGAEMPNSTDQTNNLKEGDRVLLLSEKGITDLAGISRLIVEDSGKEVPVTSVNRLHVFLNRNAISTLPDEMAKLKNVIFLYFEHNKLSVLPRALMDMDSLEGMYFTANRFTEIPPFVFQMTRLKKLQFSKNQLTALPEELGNLERLIHFNMSDNQIASIPQSIAKLTRLRVCDLSDNPFSSLPEAFGEVHILYQLRVRNCPIASLPAGFADMPATIDITGTKIDPAKLSPGLRARLGTEKPPKPKELSTQVVTRPSSQKDN
jgi:Leucine-rich repeat (LRR) protein